jgi:P-type Cu+ transporter
MRSYLSQGSPAGCNSKPVETTQPSEGSGLKLSDSHNFEAVPGHGIRAQVDEHTVLVGTARWLTAEGNPLNGLGGAVDRLQAEGKTAVVAAVDGHVVSAIGIADTVKDGPVEAIATMRQQGLNVVMMTGDNRRTAEAIAGQVGISNGPAIQHGTGD